MVLAKKKLKQQLRSRRFSGGLEQGKKRKRAGDGAAESSEQDQGSNVKGKEEEKKNKKKKAEKNKKNKRNKKRKSSQKKNTEEDKEGTKTCSSSEKKAVETATIDARDENGDAGRKVYVGGIPYYSTEDDIRSFFEGCGTVSEVDCMMFPESGKFRGIAILTFKTEAAAKRAMALDGSDIGDRLLIISSGRIVPQDPTLQGGAAAAAADSAEIGCLLPEIIDGYNRIYVGNLAWDITEEDLRAFFQGCSISAVRFGKTRRRASLRVTRTRCGCAEAGGGGREARTTVPAAAAGGGGGKKKKRQTCYECGVPGHLSSDCPQKKPAVVAAR
ncbi:unnamed protein product [Spirodela intermedia]|uniref:Uncharacterized protein n=1 Tax=Spirodela intermedia TaxID=51605 RepID=A0A7I8ICY4_SPIIN|nr:unnamed protein product [Spirodela intermedia]CAA6654902.1 unnamed protein product [Spirodela intermedia]